MEYAAAFGEAKTSDPKAAMAVVSDALLDMDGAHAELARRHGFHAGLLSLAALRDYLSARLAADGAAGRPLPSLPLFARHDRGAGRNKKRNDRQPENDGDVAALFACKPQKKAAAAAEQPFDPAHAQLRNPARGGARPEGGARSGTGPIKRRARSTTGKSFNVLKFKTSPTCRCVN